MSEKEFHAQQLIKILLVEDNPDHAMIIKRALTTLLSATVETVTNGRDALNFLKQSCLNTANGLNQQPDIILLDLKLPKLDGFQLAKIIKTDARFKSIPIIILTTSTRSEDREQLFACGVERYITKPTHFQDFQQITSEIKALICRENFV